MKLTAEEFIRRFLLHILPAGFCKIRYSGFLSTRGRKERIKRIRRLLKCKAIVGQPWSWQQWLYETTGILPGHCPACKDEKLVTLQVFQAAREPPYQYKVRAIALQ